MDRQYPAKVVYDSDSVYSDDEVELKPRHAILNNQDVDNFLELEAAVANSIYQCVQLIRQRHTSGEDYSIGDIKSFERLYETKANLLSLYHLCEELVHHDALTSPASFQNAKALHAEEEALLADFHALHELVWKGHFMETSELSELEDLFEQNLPWLGALQQKSRHHEFVTEFGERDRRTCRRPDDYLRATLNTLKLRVYLKSKTDDLLARATDRLQIQSAQKSPHNNESILEELQRSYDLLAAKHFVLRSNPKYSLTEYTLDETCKDEYCRKQQISVAEQARYLQPQYEQAAKNAEENHKLREVLLIMRKDRDAAITRNSSELLTPPIERDKCSCSQGDDAAQALGDYYSFGIDFLPASEQHQGMVIDDLPEHTDFHTRRRSLVRRIHQAEAEGARNAEVEQHQELSIAGAFQFIGATKPQTESPQINLQPPANGIAHKQQYQELDVVKLAQAITAEKQSLSSLPKTHQAQSTRVVADEERLRKPAVSKAAQATNLDVEKQRTYSLPKTHQIEAVKVSPNEEQLQEPTASKVTRTVDVQKPKSGDVPIVKRTQIIRESPSRIDIFKQQSTTPPQPPHMVQTGAIRKPSSKIAMLQKQFENASDNSSILQGPPKERKVGEMVKESLQDKDCRKPSLPALVHPKVSTPFIAENEHIGIIRSSSSHAALTASPQELPKSWLAKDLKSNGSFLSKQSSANGCVEVESQNPSFPLGKHRNLANEVYETKGTGYRVRDHRRPYPTLDEHAPARLSPATSDIPGQHLLEDRVVENPGSSSSTLGAQDVRNGLPGPARKVSRPARSLFPNREGHGSLSRSNYSSQFQDSVTSSPTLSEVPSSSQSKDDDIITIPETLQDCPEERKRSSGATARFGLPYPVYSDEDFDNIPTNIMKQYENASFSRDSMMTIDDNMYHTYLKQGIKDQKATNTENDCMQRVSIGSRASDLPNIKLNADKLQESARNPGVWDKLKGKWSTKKNGAASSNKHSKNCDGLNG